MKSLSDTVVLSRNRLSMYFLLYSFQIGLFLWQNMGNRDINMLHLVSPFWSNWNLSPFSSKVLMLLCVWPLSVIIIQMSTLYKIKNVTSVSSTLSPVSFFFNDITAKGNPFVSDSLNADLMRVSFIFFIFILLIQLLYFCYVISNYLPTYHM